MIQAAKRPLGRDMCSEVFGQRNRSPLPPKDTALLLVQG